MLPEDRPDIFYAYVQWLYDKMIYCKTTSPGRNFGFIAELYLLGEKLLDRDFQDQAISVLISIVRDDLLPDGRFVPNVFVFSSIYDRTPEGSPARRLMLDLCVRFGGKRWDFKSPKVNRDFLADITTKLFEHRSMTDRSGEELDKMISGMGCAYHHHGKDERCPLC